MREPISPTYGTVYDYGVDKVNIAFSGTPEQRQQLKVYALENNTTLADVCRVALGEYFEKRSDLKRAALFIQR